MTDFPDLLALTPAIAERHWLRFLADRDPFDGQLATLAENVTLAIREWGLNFGKAGEEKSRDNFVARYDTFKAAHTADMREPGERNHGSI